MSRRDNGGAAFPMPGGPKDAYGNFSNRPQSGMTLRDWFAGQALVAIVGAPISIGDVPITGESEFAKAAYAFADAMLAERSK